LKILILKPSSLGDVIQALPVLRLLKRHLPQSHIFWWIDSRLAPLLDGDPDLAGLVFFHRRRWAHPRNWHELLHSVSWARKQRFNWVIDLQCLLRSGAFGWLANGDRLVGLDEPREGARGFYDAVARRASFHTHAVDWYLSVLPLLGIPVDATYEWLPGRPAVAEAVRRKWPLHEGQWVLLQPGARWLNKRWPLESYSELARLLLVRRPALRFAVLGGEEDRDLGRAIATSLPNGRALDLTGRLTLPEMVECIRAGTVMVTNDTGPMHVAAALRKPLVALFGPTAPSRTGPYGQTQHVLRASLSCVPCMDPQCHHEPALECMHLIKPAEVAQHVLKHLR
jgi:lipopolysaccharide heptosyltransferase I